MKKILIILGILVLAGIGYKAYTSYTSDKTYQSDTTDQSNAAVTLTAEEQAELDLDKQAISSETKAARYTHPRLGFSFEKPAGYTVGALKDDSGETLLVQKTSVIPNATEGSNSLDSSQAQNDSRKGFQIYITALDAPMELTPNLIKSDLPGTSVNNPLQINLDNKAKGIMFSSNNDAFGGKSFEIWFVAQNNLYQISSYAEFATTLQQIIGTWKFQ